MKTSRRNREGDRETSLGDRGITRRLRESEAKFAAAFEQSPLGLTISSLSDGRFVEVNDGFLRLSGYTREEVLGHTIDELHLWVEPEHRLEGLAQMQAGGRIYTVEARFRTKQGEERVGLVGATLIDIDSRPHVLTSGIDITARKQAEEALQASEERLRLITENIDEVFWMADVDLAHMSYVSPAYERTWGRTLQSLYQNPRSFIDAIHPEDRERVLAELVPEESGPPFDIEFRIIRPDGSIRWIWNRGFPVHEPAGHINRYVGLAQDITERKRAEQMQRRHERETTTINNILRAINTHLDVKAAFPEVCAGLQELARCAAVSLSLFDERQEWLSFAAGNTPWALLGAGPGTRLHVTEWPGATDVLAGRPHIIRDLTTVLQFPIAEVNYVFGFRSVVNLPLCAGSNVIGLLNLFWREVDGCQSVEMGTLTQVANAVAIAVEKGRLFEQVRAGRERLRVLSQRLMEVQEAERRHLARELHDEIGQHLTGINLVLGTVDHLSAEGAVTRLKEVRALVDGLIARVRDVSLDLRPAMLDDFGVLPALSWLFDRYTAQTGIKVAFNHRALEQRFTAEQETAVYRIVQEALTNVARHAGVGSVNVEAWADGGILGVSVTDQGAGFDVDAELANGMTGGLAGLRERAMLLGGRLTIESKPGAGTRLIAELPPSSDSGDAAVHS
jgi:PAS domain S-box-containing protein